jgi:hypothetical protein
MSTIIKSLYLTHLFVLAIGAGYLLQKVPFLSETNDILYFVLGYFILLSGMRIFYTYHLFFLNKSISEAIKKDYFVRMHLGFIPFSMMYWYRFIWPNR